MFGRWFVLGAAGGAGGGASVFFNLVEPEKTDALLRVLEPGQVFFDIGANIGYYTQLASDRLGPGGTVVAFEPSPRNLSYLYRHVTLNRASNVVIVPVACSDTTGLAMFAENADCAEGRLVQAGIGPAPTRPSLVATVAIDDVVRLIGQTPHVVKIDVEGAEVQVLRGAAATIATARPILILAVHSAAARDACLSFLAGLDYTAETISDDAHGDLELLVRPNTALGRPKPDSPHG
jgi:FkbM family methyltransferase